MALDGIYLHFIKKEIEREALGARVNQIYQPNRDELVLALRSPQGGGKLLLSSRANSPRVNFCSSAPENPAQPPMFCMLLRKKLGGGKLTGVRQHELDRILFLDFECVNELGDATELTIACEIMGMHSNIIVFDRGTGVIIDALKRVDLTVSSRRLVLPNIRYELPEGQDKLCLLTASPEEAASRICDTEAELPLSKAILSAVQGLSPIVCRELEYRVREGASNRLDRSEMNRLLGEISKLKKAVESGGGAPCTVYREDGRPMDIAFMPIEQYGGYLRTAKGESFNSAIDEFYDERDKRERMRVKTHSLLKLLNNTRERIARKLSKQQAELERCADRESLRIRGDLLQANLYRIPRGAEEIEVENYYDPEGGTLRVRLNPAISPAANAQKYYKDYQKAKTAENVLRGQIEKGKSELEYIESVLDFIDRAETERELSRIREELTEQGYLRAPKGKQPKQQALPPLQFTSRSGFKIFVGRNNRQNDALTLKTAAKNDIWLHTKDIHGSHVIISCEGEAPDDETLLYAAQLAAYHSKARQSTNVPVDYTRVKFVSKPAGAKPGMVIYVNNKTLFVDPRQEQEEEPLN